MNQPQVPEYKLVDLSNHLLGVQNAVLSLGQVPVGDEMRLAFTIRTPSTTLTVLLAKVDAEAWSKQLSRETQRMSGTGLIVAAGAIPPAFMSKQG